MQHEKSGPGLPPDDNEQKTSLSNVAGSTEGVEHTESAAETTMAGQQTTSHRVPIPARLPETSRAAAAQRLNDLPQEQARGVWYNASQAQLHPLGWRLKRHIKRKNLRLSNLRYKAIESMGTRWTLIPMGIVMLICMFLVTSVFLTYAAISGATQQRYASQVTTLEDIIPRDNLKMYDANGHLMYQMIDQGVQISLPLDKISPNLQHAEIAVEDQSFWNNPGYDITGIARAALDDMTRGHVVGGGSTITQQLIKNSIVGNQVTAVRKLQEIVLAPEISRHYTKEQILNMYLNTTYYGEQSYGAEAAAITYFGLKDKPNQPAAAQLDIAQAATLAGIPSSPIARDPLLHPQAALMRTEEVLQHLLTQKYINHQQYQDALYERMHPNFFKRGSVPYTRANNFAVYALNELARDLHVKISDLSRSGLLVSTTLNQDWQNQAQKIIQKQVGAMAKLHNMSNGAIVVIDHHNGAIKTMVGNIDPNDPISGSFDVASQGFRQPGSSFKPFIYATAFEQGISPGTPVLDGPLTVQMCCGLPSYTPHNYDMGYHGLITYRQALANSFNIPAVKLLLKVGVDKALNTAERIGLGPYEGIPNYTMVLGSLSVHLLDVTSAYGTFATGGIRIPPHAINIVKDTTGRTIFAFQPRGKRVLSKQVAYMITSVLGDNDARTFEFGKCSMLSLFSNTQSQCYAGSPGPIRPSASKTGTSNDFRDNWTVGYTTDYSVGVWVGNNDNSPMVNVIGVDGAGPAWHDTMLLVEKGRPIHDFAVPPGLVKRKVSYPGITSTDWYLK